MRHLTSYQKILIASLALAPFAAAVQGACTPRQEQQAIGILRVIDQGCVTIQQIRLPSGEVQDACVRLDDVREAVEALLVARAALERAAKARGVASSVAPATPSATTSAPLRWLT